MVKAAAIFDLDGVLVSTVDCHYEGWKAVADALGCTFSREDNDALRGVPRAKAMDLVAGRAGCALDAAQRDSLMSLKVRVYRECVHARSADSLCEPGVGDLLACLRLKEFKLAVASASCNARLLLDRTGLTGYFDVISDGRFRGASKPAAGQLLQLASDINVAPQNCVVLEDAIVGIEAAVNAGMPFIAIGSTAARHPLARVKIQSLGNVDFDEFLDRVSDAFCQFELHHRTTHRGSPDRRRMRQ